MPFSMPRRQWIRWSVLVSSLLLAPLSILEYGIYLSHRNAIVRELQTMPDEDRHPPAAVSSMIVRYFGVQRIDEILGRGYEFEFHGVRARGLSSGLREILFVQALKLHLSREERLALFCHRMSFDGGSGLSAGARAYYGKQAAEMNDVEIAGLIASEVRGRYASPFTHPDRFESVRRVVLERIASR